MSKSRYIIRFEESFTQTVNYNYISTSRIVQLPQACDVPLLVKELYPYKDLIDYNSLLYIIIRTVKNERTMRYSSGYLNPYTKQPRFNSQICRFPENIRSLEITSDYIVVDKDARKFISDTDINQNYNRGSEFTYPACALLFNKNNECLKINVSNKVLEMLFHVVVSGDMIVSNGFVYNLGRLIWYLDFLFSINDNTVEGYSIEPEFVDFFSANRPSINGINTFGELCDKLPNHIELWLNENIDYIRKDLGLFEEPKPAEIKYIEYNDINNNIKKQHIKELLEQLRILGVDVDSIKM